MKRFLSLFALTRPEQRLIVILILLLVAGACYQHYRHSDHSAPLQPMPGTSPTPQGPAISKSPS